MSKIFFVASARDYHAMDWYRVIREICPKNYVAVLTDTINSEGIQGEIQDNDQVIKLSMIDSLLFPNASLIGGIWRNIVKVMATPVFAWRLHMFAKNHPESKFHAHSMYYAFICYVAHIKFIATPMGSDVLVRPDHSLLYRFFTITTLKAADKISVDSEALNDKIYNLCGRSSLIIQNGIDTQRALKANHISERNHITSFRGMDFNYNILDLVQSRNLHLPELPITFIYPFHEDDYLKTVSDKMVPSDNHFGRVEKEKMYDIFSQTLLAVSIPISDSSPRSVYEAVFSGCCVAVTPSRWVENLPQSMRKRIVIVDLGQDNWLSDAISQAKIIVRSSFVPCEEAIDAYDEKRAMAKAARLLYHD